MDSKKVRKNIKIKKLYAEWVEMVAKETNTTQGAIIEQAIYNMIKAYGMRRMRARRKNKLNNE